jgi:hypothetical protein
MVWRDRDTLQIGIDPRRAVALTGMRGAAGLIGLLDGSREHHQVLAAAQDQGISAAAADRIIGLLAAAGVLADFPADALRGVPDGTRTRLAGELATVSLAHGVAIGVRVPWPGAKPLRCGCTGSARWGRSSPAC